MLVGMLLFWALVIWGAVFLFRGSGSGSRDSGQADPEQILKERLSRGEISTEA